MSMKFKFNKKILAAAVLNLLSLAGFIAFVLAGSSIAFSQSYNYAFERWEGEDSDDDYAQVSCFMSASAGFTVDSVGSIRAGLLNSLKDISIVPEDGKKLCPDAYSASVGKAAVRGNILGRSDAQITAVGGDFFMIRNFRLLDGSFFSDDDIMQDGAVIDKNLAWAIYGSYDVSGMDITINGTQFYISGVIDVPETKAERKCSSELPRAYISYDGASGFASDNSGSGGMSGGMPNGDDSVRNSFKTVTCYEVIMPDPVQDYALTSVKSAVEVYGDMISIVQNSGRFGAFKRLGSLKRISSLVIRDNEVSFPYWENASRITEVKLSFIYLGAALCLVIPAVTILFFIVKGFKCFKKNKSRIFDYVKRLFIDLKSKRSKEKRE